MSLTSFSFFCLIAASVLVYYIVPKTVRWMVLLAASLVFYCCVGTPWTIVYLLASVVTVWFAGIKIAGSDQNPKAATAWFWVAIAVNIGLLFALKYANFLLSTAGAVSSWFTGTVPEWRVTWPAALGMSYYTLQIVGYLLDVRWGITEPQKNPLKLLLFTSFFPQMVSGPISRYDQLGKQLFEGNRFQKANLSEGVFRIVFGMFKKLVVAENAARLVPLWLYESSSGASTWAGMLMYVLQIYMDFSGCMDIITGAARCYGIRMTENFDKPFTSTSIQEFWRRWHITLGLWLRDYIMYPILRSKAWAKLGRFCKKHIGKKAAKTIPTDLAMLVLWLCMGLWHGGGWNFLMEGVWFWLVIVLGQVTAPLYERFTGGKLKDNFLWKTFQRVRTLLIYLIGAEFFRQGSLKDIFFTLSKMFTFPLGQLRMLPNLFRLLLFWGVFLILQFWGSLKKPWYENHNIYFMARLLIAVILIWITIIFGLYGSQYNAADFIYGGF